MKKKLKIGITGINHLNGNRGVGALAVSIIYILNKIAIEKNRMIEITAINSNFGSSMVDTGMENIEIRSILNVSLFSLKNILKLLINPKYQKSFFAYFDFDYILCMGEGDSFSDIYGAKRFKSINDQHRMARLFKNKYLLLPQTIGPFKDNQIKKQAIRSIEKAKLVFARDTQSYNYVAKNTEQNNLLEAIDVAFFMPYKNQEFTTDFIHVGLNISALLWHGGYTQNNQFGLKLDYKELVHEIIDYFLSIPRVKIHIVPHVVIQNSSIENDYEVSYHLVNEYNNPHIILAPFFLTPILAKNYIAGCEFFAGARMHANIAAFSSRVPVFPMAYSRKFNGLFADTLDYKYMGDMVNKEKHTIIDALKETFEKRKEIKKIINQRMDSVVKEREELLVDKLTNILGL